MKYVVIGGSGFIGTQLIIRLKSNVINIDKVLSPVFPNLSVVGDVRDVDSLLDVLPACSSDDIAILLAAEHKDDVTPTNLYYDVNVEGARNVVKLLEARGINKLIFTSSVAVYGLNKENPTEDFPADPFNHYGKSKWQAEEVLREWYNNDHVNRTLIILRPSVVFGPGNRGNVYNLLKQILSGRFVMIGRGTNKKSMAFVENVTSFIEHCTTSAIKGYQVFNYADRSDLSMNELITIAETALQKKLPPIRMPYFIGYSCGLVFDVLSKVTGKKFSISSIRIKKFCATTQFSSKYINTIDFEAPYSLREGLEITIRSIMKGDKN